VSPRSYNQACPFAFALDLLGERWTLLIVRDLLLGPLRFSDFLERLPGIGRNLLARRLKRLQAEEIIEQQELPPPSASTVYALTDKGRGLGPGLFELSAWGMRYGLAEGRLEGHFQPDLVGLAMLQAAYRVGQQDVPEGLDNTVHEVVLAGTVLHTTVADGRVDVFRGSATRPKARLTFEIPLLIQALQAGRLDLDAALESGGLAVLGSRETVIDLLGMFGIACRSWADQ